MQLAFSPDKKVEVSFKIGVAGTSSAPKTVTVVLERGNLALSFNAIKEGDEYRAVVQDVGVFSEGSVSMSVNVLLNGRVFTPLKTTAEIKSNITENVEVKVESFTPKLDEPKIQLPTEEVVVHPKAVKEIKVSKPLQPVVEKAKPSPMSLLKSVEPEKKVTKVTEKAVVPGTKVTENLTHFRLKRTETFVK